MYIVYYTYNYTYTYMHYVSTVSQYWQYGFQWHYTFIHIYYVMNGEHWKFIDLHGYTQSLKWYTYQLLSSYKFSSKSYQINTYTYQPFIIKSIHYVSRNQYIGIGNLYQFQKFLILANCITLFFINMIKVDLIPNITYLWYTSIDKK